jgi:hypothetical protein
MHGSGVCGSTRRWAVSSSPPRRGPVAQLGARLTGSQKVRGSNPLGSTKNREIDSFGHKWSSPGNSFSQSRTDVAIMRRAVIGQFLDLLAQLLTAGAKVIAVDNRSMWTLTSPAAITGIGVMGAGNGTVHDSLAEPESGVFELVEGLLRPGFCRQRFARALRWYP